MTDLTPPPWSAATLDLLRRNSVFGRIMRDADGNTPYLTRREPRPQQWLDARARFVAQWEAFVKIGLQQEFLEYDHCGECGGELIPTTSTVVVHREPNPDYRPPEMGETIRIPKAPPSTTPSP